MPAAVIVAAIDGLLKLISFIASVRKTNSQTAGWTDAERAGVDAKWAELQSSPAWQTDPVIGPNG